MKVSFLFINKSDYFFSCSIIISKIFKWSTKNTLNDFFIICVWHIKALTRLTTIRSLTLSGSHLLIPPLCIFGKAELELELNTFRIILLGAGSFNIRGCHSSKQTLFVKHNYMCHPHQLWAAITNKIIELEVGLTTFFIAIYSRQ